MRDECWHPECYMINKVSFLPPFEPKIVLNLSFFWKFWNVKVVSRHPTSGIVEEPNTEPLYIEEERRESAVTLKERQVRMQQQVYRIWT